jgi:hypothetical protein
MQRIPSRVSIIFLLFSSSVFGQSEKSVPTGKASTVLYRFSLDLGLLTEVRGFAQGRSARQDVGSQQDSTVVSANTPSFGLSRSALDLAFYVPRGAGVELSLRPDALNVPANAKEIDTRSGRVIEEMPSVQLLDEYRLVFKHTQVQSHLGVISRVLDDYAVSPELLGFGLRVQGPQKSFAAGFSANDLFKTGQSSIGAHSLALSLDILGGRNDRHDARIGRSSEIGESPAKREPYWGGSFQAKLALGEALKLGIGGVTLQERAETGIRQIDWYQFAVRQKFESVIPWPLQVSFEARHLRQAHERSETTISDIKLTSVGLLTSTDFRSSHQIHAGVWFGDGQMHPEGVLSNSVPVRGIQSEIGSSWFLEEQLQLTTAVTREWRRDGKFGGGYRGGFGEGQNGRSTQSRFAVRLSYKIGDQI